MPGIVEAGILAIAATLKHHKLLDFKVEIVVVLAYTGLC